MPSQRHTAILRRFAGRLAIGGLGGRVSDIFNEVDEEVRRERLRQIWERYSGLIMAVALLIVVGVGGWRGWEYWQSKRAAEAGAAFEAAANLATEGKSEEAIAAFDRVISEGTSSYRMLAQFRKAGEMTGKDREAAIRLYDELAADRSVPATFQDLAAVRAALLLVDAANYDELSRRLEPLTAADRPFRHSAREALALSAWRAGNVTATRRWIELIATDAQTPPGTRARVEVLTNLAGIGRG